MFRTILILFAILSTINGLAQYSHADLKATTSRVVNSCRQKQQRLFNSIVSARANNKLYERLDTQNYDYVFITESFSTNDSIAYIEEVYFKTGDTVPVASFCNARPAKLGIYSGNGSFYRYYKMTSYKQTFNPLYRQFSLLKRRQKLIYDRDIIIHVGCVTFLGEWEQKASKERAEHKDDYRHTFQICTLINKKEGKVIVSCQTPVRRPKFSILYYNAVWDF